MRRLGSLHSDVGRTTPIAHVSNIGKAEPVASPARSMPVNLGGVSKIEPMAIEERLCDLARNLSHLAGRESSQRLRLDILP